MNFRKSKLNDIDEMMKIVEDGKALLKGQNINQWQMGEPNRERLISDIENGVGYVLCEGNEILGICALICGQDASYGKIEGKWLSEEKEYATVHRMAVAKNWHGKGIGVEIYRQAEKIAKENNLKSLRADTHHDNLAMQKTMLKSGLKACGTIYLKGGAENGKPRIAFEKLL